MAKEVRLPQLGQTMEEGTVVNCLVKIGDEVKKGDVIFEVETDKATLEVESPAEGFVKYILVEEGQTLLVAEPMLVLGKKDEDVPQSFVDSLAAAQSVAEPAAGVSVPEPVQQVKPAEKPAKVIASPRAKKLATELGVDIAAVTGSGPGGKITEQDVKDAAGKAPVKKSGKVEIKLGAVIPINKLQKITAERMLKSKREIPCFYLNIRADVTDLVELRTKMNAEGDGKVAYNDFIISAVAAGLEKFPVMTGQLDGEHLVLADSINIGLAVDSPQGLIVPVVKNANKKNIRDIAVCTAELIEKAKAEKLALTDLEGGCITVSNLGAFGIDSFIPIVIPGQCSILGIGQIADTYVPNDGGTDIRKMMCLTLSVDHKVANGAYAAQFLDYVKKQLEDVSSFS